MPEDPRVTEERRAFERKLDSLGGPSTPKGQQLLEDWAKAQRQAAKRGRRTT